MSWIHELMSMCPPDYSTRPLRCPKDTATQLQDLNRDLPSKDGPRLNFLISLNNIIISNSCTSLHPPLPTPWSKLPFFPLNHFSILLNKQNKLAGLWGLPICPLHHSHKISWKYKYDHVTSLTSHCLWEKSKWPNILKVTSKTLHSLTPSHLHCQ